MKQPEAKAIVWRDEYSIGVSDIDLQHQRLLFLLNKLNTLISQGRIERSRILLDLLDGFNEYASYHFKAEEQLMQEHLPADEALSQHLAAHRAYWSNIPILTDRYKNGDPVAALELVDYLNNWWVDHILATDQKMGRQLQLLGVD